jgi:hypothetical protein
MRLLPIVLARQEKANRELVEKYGFFSVYFDGASRMGELLVFIMRVIDDNLRVIQRIAALETFEFSVDNANLAAAMFTVLQRLEVIVYRNAYWQLIIGRSIICTLSVQITQRNRNIHQMVALVHDSAAVNRSAAETLVCDRSYLLFHLHIMYH